MHSFEVERLIAAGPKRIWAVLTDPVRLAGGPFGIIRIDGMIASGSHFKLWSAVAPKRAFPLRVTVFEPSRRMEWTGGMPLGLFTGQRSLTLTPEPGGTRFAMQEVYTGAMLSLIWPSMPDLGPSFQQFAAALAAATETSA